MTSGFVFKPSGKIEGVAIRKFNEADRNFRESIRYYSTKNTALFAQYSWQSTTSVSQSISSTGTTEFEPLVPSTPTLVAFVIILFVSAAAAQVWANDVVPAKRTELAISKSRGEMKEYLEELKQAGLSEHSADGEVQTQVRKSNSRKFERWLFSDWLVKKTNSKPSALPFLPKAKWNSGDNPVLVASGLIMLGVIAASVLEKFAS